MRTPYIRKAEIVSHKSSLLKLLGLRNDPFEHREDRVPIPFAQQTSECSTALVSIRVEIWGEKGESYIVNKNEIIDEIHLVKMNRTAMKNNGDMTHAGINCTHAGG